MPRLTAYALFTDATAEELKQGGRTRVPAAELADRWRMLDRKLVLAVRTDLGHFTLSWQDERLHMGREALRTAARLDQRALTELLLGYKTASSLKTNDQLACNRTQLTLLEHLFPPQRAHMSWPDRF